MLYTKTQITQSSASSKMTKLNNLQDIQVFKYLKKCVIYNLCFFSIYTENKKESFLKMGNEGRDFRWVPRKSLELEENPCNISG